MNEQDTKNHETDELTTDELDQVSGGLVVAYGKGEKALVIDDESGVWVEEIYNNLDRAIQDARDAGCGDEVIFTNDREEYRRYFRESNRASRAWLKSHPESM